MEAIQASGAVIWPRRASRPLWLERYGPLLLALFLLAASRWGSYLLPGPPYIADVVLGLLVVNLVLVAAVRGRAPQHVEPLVGVATGLLLLWVAIETLFSPVTQTALRDAVPYLYAVLVFIVFSFAESDERWVKRAITAALVFHAAWLTLSFAGLIGPVGSLGGGQTQIFESRDDIDSTVCGLLAVIALNRALMGRAFLLNLVIAAWGAGLVFALHTRAGLLAFVAQLAALALLRRARLRDRTALEQGTDNPKRVRQALRARAAPVVVTAALLLMAPLGAVVAQGAFNRLLATFVHQQPVAGATLTPGAGTASARTAAWGHLAGWMLADPGRTVLGVGPGPDFLKESGTTVLLLGENAELETRNPHDYLLNTWGRFGLIGVMLIVGVLAAGLRLAVLVARGSPTIRDSDLLATMIVVSIPVVAMFGVVLEAPFGAIPYFWALGHLSARWCALERERGRESQA